MLETLYSIDSRDKVRHWSIFVSGDSYHTESGLVGSEYKVTKTKPKKVREHWAYNTDDENVHLQDTWV